jgi:hypothetical protein
MLAWNNNKANYVRVKHMNIRLVMEIKPEARQACPDPPDLTADPLDSEIKWVGSG